MPHDKNSKIMKEGKHRENIRCHRKKTLVGYQKSAARIIVKSDTRTPMLLNLDPAPSYKDETCGIPVSTDVDSVLSVSNNTNVAVVITAVP
jgi:hypothetical protein